VLLSRRWIIRSRAPLEMDYMAPFHLHRRHMLVQYKTDVIIE
jgi:hypothetical protein